MLFYYHALHFQAKYSQVQDNSGCTESFADEQQGPSLISRLLGMKLLRPSLVPPPDSLGTGLSRDLIRMSLKLSWKLKYRMKKMVCMEQANEELYNSFLLHKGPVRITATTAPIDTALSTFLKVCITSLLVVLNALTLQLK